MLQEQLSFQLDVSSRKLFYQRKEMMSLQHQIDVIKKKNEMLIYNILPAHVAKDFIGMKRRDDVSLFKIMQK